MSTPTSTPTQCASNILLQSKVGAAEYKECLFRCSFTYWAWLRILTLFFFCYHPFIFNPPTQSPVIYEDIKASGR